MRMKKIYLCGPMTGLPELNFPAFNAEAARLRGLGYEVVNPAENQSDEPKTWHEYMRIGIAQMLGCDGVVMLPYWHESKGATMEVRVAEELGLYCVQNELVIDGPIE